MSMTKEEFEKYQEAADLVCLNCNGIEEDCDECRVRKSMVYYEEMMKSRIVYVVFSLCDTEEIRAEATICGVFRDHSKASALVKKLYEEKLEEENIDPNDSCEVYCKEDSACIEPNGIVYFRYEVWVQETEVQ